ncbi:hypothetical protein X975_01439, partial [Stegodyphus mimosarum]
MDFHYRKLIRNCIFQSRNSKRFACVKQYPRKKKSSLKSSNGDGHH